MADFLTSTDNNRHQYYYTPRVPVMLRTCLLDGSDAPTCRNGDSLKQRHTFVQCHSNNALPKCSKVDHTGASPLSLLQLRFYVPLDTK